MSNPPLSTGRTIGAGRVLRRGSETAYRELALGPGEPHVVRTELGGAAEEAGLRRGRVLLSLAHVTDLQLADVQSPARFEFFNRETGDPRFAKLVPVQRPQEAVAAHAAEAMVATINRVAAGPVGGAPLDLVVTTGDAIDNAQWNELRMFLALMDGGLVEPGSGGACYEGVQAHAWPDDIYWRPEPGPPDVWRTRYGFGDHPGLLERATTAFRTGGLDLPWLACYGNHEGLIQGVGVITEAVARAMVGGRKPSRLPAGADRDEAAELFVRGCEAFLDGDPLAVTPDPARRPLSRADFVAAHLAGGARPAGHGFGEANRRDGTCYYVHDTPAVRLVALDTTAAAGAADGRVDADQLRWLERVLAEVHAEHRAPDGSTVRTGREDRLVVLFSHHGLGSLTNERGASRRPDGTPAGGAAEVEELLHRFPNVVLWLHGHTHVNAVRPRPHPTRPGAGFWEVTTCAVMDWPGQARLVELLDGGDGTLRIACTMIDHDSPVVPDLALTGREQLAGLHRELAANVPFSGLDSVQAGTIRDRNTVLSVRAPFLLREE